MTKDNARSLYELSTTPIEACNGAWAHRVISTLSQLDYKYINPFSRIVSTPFGAVHIPDGLLSDGASCAPDRSPASDAWWSHDRLYLSPWLQRGERRVKCSRRKADAIYALKVARDGHPIEAAISYVALRAAGEISWNRYRDAERELGADMLFALHCLPHRKLWRVFGYMLRNVQFVGNTKQEGR